jgi:Exoribonuclease R
MTANGRKIREQVLALLERKDYRPLNNIDIARELGLSGTQRNALRKTLRELERAGDIARIRKNRYVLPAEADLVTGKLSIHQAGYGFLIPETPGRAGHFHRSGEYWNSHAPRPRGCAYFARCAL